MKQLSKLVKVLICIGIVFNVLDIICLLINATLFTESQVWLSYSIETIGGGQRFIGMYMAGVLCSALGGLIYLFIQFFYKNKIVFSKLILFVLTSLILPFITNFLIFELFHLLICKKSAFFWILDYYFR